MQTQLDFGGYMISKKWRQQEKGIEMMMMKTVMNEWNEMGMKK